MKRRNDCVDWKLILLALATVSVSALAQQEPAPTPAQAAEATVEIKNAGKTMTNIVAEAVEPVVTNPPPAVKLQAIPIIIEKATTRGRVVMLEDKNFKREVVANVSVLVFYIDENNIERKLYQTKTDEDGMFSLPELEEGIYRLVVGVTPMLMQVIPTETKLKEQERAAPKALLILMPKQAI